MQHTFMCTGRHKVCKKGLFKSTHGSVKQGCIHATDWVFPPFQEFATDHPERDIGGQRLLRSGQCGLLHCDDAKWAAALSGCCRRKKATLATGVKFNPTNCSMNKLHFCFFSGASIDFRRQSLLPSVVDRSALCCLFYIRCSKWKLLHC